MLINYFRSSSISNWSFCQTQYYLVYVLGFPTTANKKAQQGTAVHKVLEILANCKKIMQDNPDKQEYEFNDEHIGMVKWTSDEFLEPYQLSNSEVEAINKTRINKYKYKYDTKIPYGKIRYGVKLVDELFERSYNYYSEDDWYPVDKKDCHNWSWIALEYKDGIFDPRKRKIIEAEPKFDIEIDKPWAKYNWNLPCGENISGNLRIKGTIDLITEPEDGIIEVVDWKGLPIYTDIPTVNGWSSMEKLKVGDLVFDESGNTTKVLQKSQINSRPCYEIEFADKTSVVCDNEHLWKLSNGDVVNVLDLTLKDKINRLHKISDPPILLPSKITKIEYVGHQKTQCIMVDSPTSTYLCTKDLIVTHNTGQRIDWTSKKDKDVKTYSKLCEDFQLLLYHYAVSRIYPDCKDIITSIFFIRDGGPFTICTENSTEKIEKKLQERFEEIKACQKPTMQDPTQKNFKCTKLCDFYKMVAPDGDNMCNFIHKQIDKHGIEYVTNEYSKKGFKIGHYEAPG